MLIITTIAAFTAATISAGVTLYAYSKGKRAGHAQGFAKGLEAARPTFSSPLESLASFAAMAAILSHLPAFSQKEPSSTPEPPTDPSV